MRYSSTGQHIVSVGTDKKITIYDGVSGSPTSEISNAHEGGIYSVSFSPDGGKFVTVSADKTVKIWAIDSTTPLQTISMAADADHVAQLGK